MLGKTNTPEFGIAAVHRAGAERRLPQPVGHCRGRRAGRAAAPRRRSRPGWSRPRRAATAADRSASPPVVLRPVRDQAVARPGVAGAATASARGLVDDGPLARTVARRRALLDVMAGYGPATRTGRRRPSGRSPTRSSAEPGALRIG